MEEYMKKSVKTIKVEFDLTQHHVDAINEILKKLREYENESGKKPFADYSFDDMCRAIYRFGSYHTTDNHIKEVQFQMQMITADQLISDGMKTVVEWQEEGQQVHEGGI